MSGHIDALTNAVSSLKFEAENAIANGDLRAARYIISAATQLASYAFEDCPREQPIIREQMRRINKEMFEWGTQIRNRIENGEGNHA